MLCVNRWNNNHGFFHSILAPQQAPAVRQLAGVVEELEGWHEHAGRLGGGVPGALELPGVQDAAGPPVI